MTPELPTCLYESIQPESTIGRLDGISPPIAFASSKQTGIFSFFSIPLPIEIKTSAFSRSTSPISS